MSLVIQNLPNVYSDPSTLADAQRVFACPAALEFAQSDAVFKPLYITSSKNLSGPRGGLIYGDDYHSPKRSHITLPTQSLESDEAVKHLAFELFNLNTKKSSFLEKADKGEVGMDEFARATEIQEIEDTQGFLLLEERCSKIWDIPVEASDYTLANMDLESDLFAQEIQCHTDAVRERWIGNFQKIYCKKHPEDVRSCSIKKEDLCNFQKMLKNPRAAEKVVTKRVCELFPKAAESVKNNPQFQTIVKAFCPEALPNENIFLTALINLIGGAAAV